MSTIKVFASSSVLATLLASAAFAQSSVESESYSASVSGALAGDTGFLSGGQVQVDGVGQGSLVLSRGQASVDVLSGAISGFGDTAPPFSSATMLSTLDFDRDVNTSAALVGVGNVVAQGESIGGIGVIGQSGASAEVAGIIQPTGTGTGTDTGVFSGNSATTAQGSLVGQFSTSNTLQLLGEGSLFAGSQSLDLAERTQGFSGGRTGDISVLDAGVDLSGLGVEYAGFLNLGDDGALGGTGSNADTLTGSGTFTTASITGNGAGFGMFSSLGGTFDTIPTGVADLADYTIDVNVANAGNGSVLVSGSTGGFFGQGTAFGATGSLSLSDVGGFFTLVD